MKQLIGLLAISLPLVLSLTTPAPASPVASTSSGTSKPTGPVEPTEPGGEFKLRSMRTVTETVTTIDKEGVQTTTITKTTTVECLPDGEDCAKSSDGGFEVV